MTAAAAAEAVDVAGLLTGESHWRGVYGQLRAYKGLRPDDRVARCGGCNTWCINPDDHGGRPVNSIPRPWASKEKPGVRPVCLDCAAKAARLAAAYAEPAVPAGYAV